MSYYDDPIETETYRGFTIDVLPDEDPPDPQRDYDPFGVMVCFHGGYDLGSADHGYHEEDYTGWKGLRDAIVADHPGAVILPLALLDHSGITMRVGEAGAFWSDPQGWDSGQVGFIFASCEMVGEAFNLTPHPKHPTWTGSATMERTEAALRAEVEQYARYLEGSVVVFTVTATSGLVIDSLGGYYNVDDALTGARTSVDGHIDYLDTALDDVRDVTKGIALVALAGEETA